MEFKQLTPDQIILSDRNPRKTFEAHPLQELADSIAEKGVLQPILVRMTSHAYKYELVCGERRYRASIMALQTTIPAMVRDIPDDEALEIALMENFQRQDVHPIEEAVGFKQLQLQCRMKPAQIAFRVGKSVQYVASRLRLAGLIPELHQPFFEGKFDSATAHNLAVQPEEAQRQYFEEGDFEDVQEDSISLENAPFDQHDAKYIPTAGACVGCKFNSATAELFPEHATPRCLNTSCFLDKTSKAIIEVIRELQSTGTVILYDNGTERNKSIMTALENGEHYSWNACPSMELPDLKEHQEEIARITADEDYDEDERAQYLQDTEDEFNEDTAKFHTARESGEWRSGILIRRGSSIEEVLFKNPSTRSNVSQIKVKDIVAKTAKGEATLVERSMAVDQLKLQIESEGEKLQSALFDAAKAQFNGMVPVFFEKAELSDEEISSAMYLMIHKLGYKRDEFAREFTGVSMDKLNPDWEPDESYIDAEDMHIALMKHLADKNGHIPLRIFDLFQRAYTRYQIFIECTSASSEYHKKLFVDFAQYHFQEQLDAAHSKLQKQYTSKVEAINKQIADIQI
jgi:ParB/RepB/Spo0J family partition protein